MPQRPGSARWEALIECVRIDDIGALKGLWSLKVRALAPVAQAATVYVSLPVEPWPSAALRAEVRVAS